jgi:hypothetical protein
VRSYALSLRDVFERLPRTTKTSAAAIQHASGIHGPVGRAFHRGAQPDHEKPRGTPVICDADVRLENAEAGRDPGQRQKLSGMIIMLKAKTACVLGA